MRLIDADALKDCFPCPAEEFEMKGQQTLWDAREIRETIDLMPTVDAVEVVRCKDCKHYTEPNIEYCELYGAMILWGKDDFCSRGERRTDE